MVTIAGRLTLQPWKEINFDVPFEHGGGGAKSCEDWNIKIPFQSLQCLSVSAATTMWTSTNSTRKAHKTVKGGYFQMMDNTFVEGIGFWDSTRDGMKHSKGKRTSHVQSGSSPWQGKYGPWISFLWARQGSLIALEPSAGSLFVVSDGQCHDWWSNCHPTTPTYLNTHVLTMLHSRVTY